MSTTHPENDADSQLERDIHAEVSWLEVALASTQTGVRGALAALAELMGSRLYAVEYAEGSTGADIRHHLETAARSLRAAEALHDRAKRAELGEGRAVDNERVGFWRGQEYRVGDEAVAPDEDGVEWRCRVTGVGDEGRVYVEPVAARKLNRR